MPAIYFLIVLTHGTLTTTGPLTQQQCLNAATEDLNFWAAAGLGQAFSNPADWRAAGSPADAIVAECKQG